MANAIWDVATALDVALSDANLTATNTGDCNVQGVVANYSTNAINLGNNGKWYFEVTINSLTTSFVAQTLNIGITAPLGSYVTYNDFANKALGGVGVDSQGAIYSTGLNTIYALNIGAQVPPGLRAGDTIGIAIDFLQTGGKGGAWFKIVAGPSYPNPLGWNGDESWNGTPGTTPYRDPTAGFSGDAIPGGAMTPVVAFNDDDLTQSVTFNFGASPFLGSVPFGFAQGWGVPSAGASADPFQSSVVFLCGFEHSVLDESTTNNKGLGAIATLVFGGFNFSDTIFKIGNSSLLLPSNNGVRWADSNDWNFTGNFTIECWIYTSTVAGSGTIIAQWTTSGGQQSWQLIRIGNLIEWQVSTTGANSFNDLTSGPISINTWYAVAIDFDGVTYRMYMNGVMVASSTTLRTIFNSTSFMTIGSTATGTVYFTGEIDEVRITKGVARYASNAGYTPATTPFPRFVIPVTPATLDPTTAHKATVVGNTVTNADVLIPEQGVLADQAWATGKRYFEITYDALNDADTNPGLALPGVDYLAFQADGTGGVIFYDNGVVWSQGSNIGFADGNGSPGDVLAIAVDLDNHSIWFQIVAGPNFTGNGWNSGAGDPATNTGGFTIPAGSLTPIVAFGGFLGDLAGNAVTANFCGPFIGALPAGFVEWCPPPPPPVSYRLLVPHWLAVGYAEGGTIVTEGVNIPVGWEPTMAVEPLTTAAIQAYWDAGPRIAAGAEYGEDFYTFIPSQRPAVYWQPLGPLGYFQLTGAGAVLGAKASG